MIGTAITVHQLEQHPHPILARLREHEPVSWLPALDGWLVTRHDLVLAAMRDPETFTVEDPRFSTAQVVGPSMLSLDGDAHVRHRAAFVAPFRPAPVRERFAAHIAEEANELIDRLRPARRGELRRSFAGPLAAAVVVRALGLRRDEVPSALGWYDAIVAAVTEITAGRRDGGGAGGREAFARLRSRLQEVIDRGEGDGEGARGGEGERGGEAESLLAAAADCTELSDEQLISDAAVLLFGGIETTEGMIANAILQLLGDPELCATAREQPALLDAAIEESLRLEPAAAVVDRYATREAELGGIVIGEGDLVRLSITAANRDPALFEDPDRFDPRRPNVRRHLAFAQGPHVCVGVHLARLEARTAISALLTQLPALQLDPERPAAVTGLVFRKPERLDCVWS